MLKPQSIFKNFDIVSLANRLKDCLPGPFWQFRAMADDEIANRFFVQYSEGLKKDPKKMRWLHLVSTDSLTEAQQLVDALKKKFKNTASCSDANQAP